MRLYSFKKHYGDKSKPALSVVVDLVGGGPNKTAYPGCGITAPLRRCNVWSIPSMEDGQGRALGSGSIPDASASPKGRKKETEAPG